MIEIYDEQFVDMPWWWADASDFTSPEEVNAISQQLYAQMMGWA